MGFWEVRNRLPVRDHCHRLRLPDPSSTGVPDFWGHSLESRRFVNLRGIDALFEYEKAGSQ